MKKIEWVDKINKELRGKGKTYIGYDLGAGYGEVSVFTEHSLKPVTLLSRNDATVFHFPCMLVKYNGRFYAGFEALALSTEEGAYVFEDLLEIAMNQATIVVGGQRFDTEYLLGLFLKLTLQLPEEYGKLEKAGGIMFTTYIDEDPALQMRVYEVLTRATAQFFGKRTKLYLQTRSESIYYFMMHQEESMYQENTLIFDYQKDYLRSYFFRIHGTSEPFTVSVDRVDYPDMQVIVSNGQSDRTVSKETYLDRVFYQVLENVEKNYNFGLSYLIGDEFKGDWLNQSLNKLCTHGRVFQGNNLYSMGACYCLRQVVEENPILEQYIYLSKQEIAFDIGIYCRKQGVMQSEQEAEYISIFQGGSAYEDCKKELYLIPEGEKELLIEAKALSNHEPKFFCLDLQEFEVKQTGLSKWKVSLEFLNQQTLEVRIEDIGLGQVFPGSGKIRCETIYLE